MFQLKSSRWIVGVLAIAFPMCAIAQVKGKITKVTSTKPKPALIHKAAADTGTQPFQLVVGTTGFPDSTLALIIHPANQQYQGPSGVLKNGSATLQGNIPQEDVYLLVLTDNKTHANDKYYNLYLDNQHSQIALTSSSADVEVVKGESMKAFNEMLKTFGPPFNELTRINQMRQQATASGQASDSLNARFGQLAAQVNGQIPPFVTKYASSPVAAYLLYTTQPLTSPDQLQRNIALLKGAAATNGRTQQLQQYLAQEQLRKEAELRDTLFAQGKWAPDFTQNDTLGKPVSLSSFKGRYVLVDFWASWCGPCRMENPNVVNAFNQYKDKGFTVLGVSLDQDRGKWLKAIHDDNLTWTHLSDLQSWSNAVARQYNIQQIPRNFLIGPDGKIIARDLRGGVLQAYLRDLLK
jgi:peroxiredoxin